MSDWQEIDTFDLAAKRGKNVEPPRKHIMLSPYDVPYSYRVLFSESATEIEFRYIKIDEDRMGVEAEGGIRFNVGKKTKRIYSISESSDKRSSSDYFKRRPEDFENIKMALKCFIEDNEIKEKGAAKYEILIKIIDSI